MNILFLHRSFPAQFKYLATILAQDPKNLVLFITHNDKDEIQGINKLSYKLQKEVSPNCHEYLETYEEAILHGQAAANMAGALKQKGIIPDVIIGFSWGPPLFIKEIFQDVPFICYFEWFGKTENSVFDFGGKVLSEDQKARIKCNNSHVLMDLYNCDAGLSPTNWQKAQFPKEYQDKITVIHDGIDTELCKPDENAKFLIKDKNIELGITDEVITYATRGMEAYRGFPEFMYGIDQVLKRRPKAHVVIAGEDAVCYGPKPTDGTYKEYFLKKLNLDINRVHFVGKLPFEEYVQLLKISSAHIYLTYPFILSWSILEAMSCGCCVIASNTAPVLEVIQDNYNGLLVDFSDINKLIEKIEYVLNNQDKIKEIRKNARQTILDKYDIKDRLPEQVNFINSVVQKFKKEKGN